MGDSECIICCEPREARLLPCGHAYACVSCTLQKIDTSTNTLTCFVKGCPPCTTVLLPPVIGHMNSFEELEENQPVEATDIASFIEEAWRRALALAAAGDDKQAALAVLAEEVHTSCGFGGRNVAALQAANSGIFSPLLAMLNGEDDELARASQLLSNLMVNNAAASAIVRAGVIPKLMALLSVGDVTARHPAALSRPVSLTSLHCGRWSHPTADRGGKYVADHCEHKYTDRVVLQDGWRGSSARGPRARSDWGSSVICDVCVESSAGGARGCAGYWPTSVALSLPYPCRATPAPRSSMPNPPRHASWAWTRPGPPFPPITFTLLAHFAAFALLDPLVSH